VGRTLLDLVRESVIVQGILTIMVTGAALYLWCSGQSVNEVHEALLWVLVGLWVGGKVEQSKRSMMH